MNDDQKKALEIAKKNWEEGVAREHAKYSQTHDKKEFYFTTNELRQVVKIHTIEYIAHQTIEDKLNNECLPRVGVTPNQNTHLMYDAAAGMFVVWIPKQKAPK